MVSHHSRSVREESLTQDHTLYVGNSDRNAALVEILEEMWREYVFLPCLSHQNGSQTTFIPQMGHLMFIYGNLNLLMHVIRG